MTATLVTTKTSSGNFFEDFAVGQQLPHPTPRTVSVGDAGLYTSLYGTRFAMHSSDVFAQSLGLQRAPIDDLLVFHLVFGKTVADVSVNAVANLGYAEGRFGVPVFPGDTLSATSTVIGVKQNSNGKTGTVYVHSTGTNQRGEMVLEYKRWVMVRKRDASAAAPPAVVPDLVSAVSADDMVVPPSLNVASYDYAAAGASHTFEDYAVGERIDHVDGMTVEEADHMCATRLYQNSAKVHFNQHTEKEGRFGKRLVYGGHVISLARSASFNGLANALKVVAINGGRHVAPIFAGDTVYAWSEVLDKLTLSGREDVGALRLRTVGVKDSDCSEFPYQTDDGKFDARVVLDFDYTVLLPCRS